MNFTLAIIFVAFVAIAVSGYPSQWDDIEDTVVGDEQSEGQGIVLLARSKRDATDFLPKFREIFGECYTPDHQRTCNKMCQETQKSNDVCYCNGRCGWYRWRRECRCGGDHNCQCRYFN